MAELNNPRVSLLLTRYSAPPAPSPSPSGSPSGSGPSKITNYGRQLMGAFVGLTRWFVLYIGEEGTNPYSTYSCLCPLVHLLPVLLLLM